jgi:hypothetical protein
MRECTEHPGTARARAWYLLNFGCHDLSVDNIQTREAPSRTGYNSPYSIQLMNDGKRWWIVTIFWQGEDKKNPLPEKYLKHQ